VPQKLNGKRLARYGTRYEFRERLSSLSCSISASLRSRCGRDSLETGAFEGARRRGRGSSRTHLPKERRTHGRWRRANSRPTAYQSRSRHPIDRDPHRPGSARPRRRALRLGTEGALRSSPAAARRSARWHRPVPPHPLPGVRVASSGSTIAASSAWVVVRLFARRPASAPRTAIKDRSKSRLLVVGPVGDQCAVGRATLFVDDMTPSVIGFWALVGGSGVTVPPRYRSNRPYSAPRRASPFAAKPARPRMESGTDNETVALVA
jgi:hypothetical protein